jgi:hypothetical protein
MKNELITLMAIAITASPFTFAEAQSYKGGKQGDGSFGGITLYSQAIVKTL